MIDKYIKYISKFLVLNEEEKEAVIKSLNIKEFRKGTILLKEGQISKEGYFILKGCLRKYIIRDGDEITTNFYTEEEWVSSITSYKQEEPADHYLSCIEDCTLIVGHKNSEKEFHKLCQKFPRLEILARNFMESEVSKYQEMLTSYKTDTPEQRYINLIKNRPELIQRVPLKQLASYIGVKPESLSRIRKRILKDK